MIYLTPQLLFFLETLLFISVIFMHLARKNFTLILLYVFQSLIVTISLFCSSIKDGSYFLVAVVAMTFLVKVIIAPYFFFGLIKKNQAKFSASTYLNTPTTLAALALLASFSYSDFFKSLTVLAPLSENSILLALSMIFISIFLVINRKGVLSQMIGILSLENAIVSFAYITGLESTAASQAGIIFDIFIWIVISTVFTSMIYRHFGSLDVSIMEKLKEE